MSKGKLVYAKLKKQGTDLTRVIIVHTENKLKFYKSLGFNVIREVRL